MKRFGLLGSSALCSAAFFGATLATPAYAQDTDCSTLPTQAERDACVADEAPPASSDGAAAGSEQTVTVTGSRIRSPNLNSTVPITSIGGEQFFQQGHTNIGDTLNELPQLRSTFAQQNPGLGIGIAGLNLLDLRGLGTQRTLVLVNGRRHVAADILNNAVSPDVNSIPNDLIERVDIVTGGNSAIYGSDAIAGVVNFVLRRDFERSPGPRPGRHLAEQGFGGNQYVSAMDGRNFGDGARQCHRARRICPHRTACSRRTFPAFRRNDNFVIVDLDPAPAWSTAATASRTPRSSRTSAAARSTSAAWSRSPRVTFRRRGLRQRDGRERRRHEHRRHRVQLHVSLRPTTDGSSRKPARASVPARTRLHRRQRPDRPRRPDALGPAVHRALQFQPARAITSSATLSRSSSRRSGTGSTRWATMPARPFIQSATPSTAASATSANGRGSTIRS